MHPRLVLRLQLGLHLVQFERHGLAADAQAATGLVGSFDKLAPSIALLGLSRGSAKLGIPTGQHLRIRLPG